jgi:uncharacterized protein (TIGR02145 family)
MNRIVHSQMFLLKLFVLIITINYQLLTINCFSQNGVSINKFGIAADNSAILDISSTSQGLLIPLMTTVKRDAIISPAISLLIFNTTTNCFEAYVNGNWFSVSCAPACIPPVIPTEGTNTASLTQIVWNWSIVSGAAGYKLSTANNYASSKDNGVSTKYTQTDLICNTSYTLYIWAYNNCGISSFSILTQPTIACCSPIGCLGKTSITDSRDNQVYNIVQIGSQCWMAQNLNYGTYVITHQSPQLAGEKYCFQNNSSCPYGGLYDWANMMRNAVSCNGTGQSQPACINPVQGICPTGWHIPSYFEFILLERSVGNNPEVYPWTIIDPPGRWMGQSQGIQPPSSEATNLQSTAWGGTNNSCFTAIPGGTSNGDGTYGNNSLDFYIYNSTEYANAPAQAWVTLLLHYPYYVNVMTLPKTQGLTVRCLKN